MKNTLKISLLLLVLIGCKPSENKSEVPVVHFNINIVTDLTNRITYKQDLGLKSDTILINRFLDSYKEKIYPFRRSLYQKDVIRINRVSSYNNSIDPPVVDLNRFKNQKDRIQYINSSLDTDLTKLKHYAWLNYQNSGNASGDLLSFFDSQLNDLNLFKDTIVGITGQNKFKNYHKNTVIVFTDGYLEAGNYDRKNNCQGNTCNFLNEELIEEIRSGFNSNNLDFSLKSFIQEKGYQITPSKNEDLKYVDLIFLEIVDRSLKKSGSVGKKPTDFEIMEILWSDWAKKSGLKTFQFNRTISGANQLDQIINQQVLNIK